MSRLERWQGNLAPARQPQRFAPARPQARPQAPARPVDAYRAAPRINAGSRDESALRRRLAAYRPDVASVDVATLQRWLAASGYNPGPIDGDWGPKTRQALTSVLAHMEGRAPSRPPARPPVHGPVGPRPGGRMAGLGQTHNGLTIPGGGVGKGTTFWNGHISYKGKYDMLNRQNAGKGAWGDMCRPTDYMVALPVSDRRWHNQKILLTDPATGRQVVALVQDKGPGASTGAKIDLSPVTMEALGKPFNGSIGRVYFEFAPDNAPLGPVR